VLVKRRVSTFLLKGKTLVLYPEIFLSTVEGSMPISPEKPHMVGVSDRYHGVGVDVMHS
jgi:hypothetical protein